MSKSARVLIFTGDGKGKTTAALGMALRAKGHDMPVCIVQFIKHDVSVGEVRAAAGLSGVRLIQTGLGFVPPASSPAYAKHQAAAMEGLRQASQIIASGQYAMVILDEVCGAVAKGLLQDQQVIAAVRQAPAEACIVLTGRDATPGLIAIADTVSEMRCIKHGLQSGHTAQKGVEL